MPLTYNQNKAHIYKWREANREKVNAYSAKRMKESYKPTLPYNYDYACRQLRGIKTDYFLV